MASNNSKTVVDQNGKIRINRVQRILEFLGDVKMYEKTETK